MKKIFYAVTLLFLAEILFLPVEGNAQMGAWVMGPGYGPDPGYSGAPGGFGYGYCPYGGPHMGYGRGYGMGPGMMGPGYYGPQQGSQKPLEEKDAKAMLENYLQSTGNPNLKLGKVTEKGPYFEAEILTKNNSLADKVLVDKNTGWMRSAY